MLLTIAFMNLTVGALVGISGIAGFLLPIVFTGYLGLDLSLALALSFLSFLTSGIIGSFRYYKQGQMDLKFGILIGIGSLFGSILGVRLNFIIPLATAKFFLYLVVLASGLSILLKKENADDSKPDAQTILKNRGFVLFLGLITGAVCALSGAGGPVLVMPLLVTFGLPVRTAIGVSLFDSIFIALPACVGYLGASPRENLALLCFVSIVCQAVGVFFGSGMAGKISIGLLKKAVAVFSIGISLYMIYGLF